MFISSGPHGLQHARFPCPSPSPRVCPNSCPLNWWCHLAISSSIALFFCLPSSPASEVFSNESVFHIRHFQKIEQEAIHFMRSAVPWYQNNKDIVSRLNPDLSTVINKIYFLLGHKSKMGHQEDCACHRHSGTWLMKLLSQQKLPLRVRPRKKTQRIAYWFLKAVKFIVPYKTSGI